TDELRQLVELDLVRDAGAGRFGFAHGSIRDAAHDLLPVETRRVLHALAADWLEKVGADPSIVAEHWLATATPERAGPCLVRAAELALSAGDLGGALALAHDAASFELVPELVARTQLMIARLSLERADPVAARVAAGLARRVSSDGSIARYEAARVEVSAAS